MVGHPERQSSDLSASAAILSNSSSTSAGHLHYPRHFLLLIGLSILLAVLARTHPSSDLNASFALFGALHASALVFTLRVRPSIWLSCLFVAIAAGLCVMTLRIGMLGTHLFGALPGHIGLYAVLGFSAATGALAYGMLIRRLPGLCAMPLSSLAAISLGCMLAAWVALLTGSYFHLPGPSWLAILWWHAFSGGLWYFDRP